MYANSIFINNNYHYSCVITIIIIIIIIDVYTLIIIIYIYIVLLKFEVCCVLSYQQYNYDLSYGYLLYISLILINSM